VALENRGAEFTHGVVFMGPANNTEHLARSVCEAMDATIVGATPGWETCTVEKNYFGSLRINLDGSKKVAMTSFSRFLAWLQADESRWRPLAQLPPGVSELNNTHIRSGKIWGEFRNLTEAHCFSKFLFVFHYAESMYAFYDRRRSSNTLRPMK